MKIKRLTKNGKINKVTLPIRIHMNNFMLSQNKMQLWYPRTTSEDNINTYFDNSNEKCNSSISTYVKNFNTESEGSENDYDNVEYFTSDGDRSIFSSSNQSPQHSDCEDYLGKYKKRNSYVRKSNQISDFIDLKYWKVENLCCGTIFRGIYGEIIVDPSLIKPCENRLTKTKKEKNELP